MVKLDLPRPAPADRGILSPGNLAGLMLVTVLWALCYPLITTGLTMAPPFTFAALRALVAGISLLLSAFVLRHPLPRGWKTWLGLVGVGFSATSMAFTGMFLAGGIISPGLATVLANAQPLIAAVLAYYALGERLKPAHRLGLVLGFAGIVLIATPGFGGGSTGTTLAGIGYVLLGALGVAVGNVLLKRMAAAPSPPAPSSPRSSSRDSAPGEGSEPKGLPKEEERGDRIDLLMAAGWQFVLGAVPLWLAAQAFELPQTVEWSLSFFAVLGVLSLLGTALAFALWFSLLRRGGLTRLNTFTFLTPVLALVIGVLFYAESLQLVELGGITLTVAGAMWVSKEPALSQSPERSEGEAKG